MIARWSASVDQKRVFRNYMGLVKFQLSTANLQDPKMVLDRLEVIQVDLVISITLQEGSSFFAFSHNPRWIDQEKLESDSLTLNNIEERFLLIKKYISHKHKKKKKLLVSKRLRILLFHMEVTIQN